MGESPLNLKVFDVKTFPLKLNKVASKRKRSNDDTDLGAFQMSKTNFCFFILTFLYFYIAPPLKVMKCNNNKLKVTYIPVICDGYKIYYYPSDKAYPPNTVLKIEKSRDSMEDDHKNKMKKYFKLFNKSKT